MSNKSNDKKLKDYDKKDILKYLIIYIRHRWLILILMIIVIIFSCYVAYDMIESVPKSP